MNLSSSEMKAFYFYSDEKETVRFVREETERFGLGGCMPAYGIHMF